MPDILKGLGVFLLVVGGSFGVWGCSGKPQEIAYGQDTCAFCQMGISDPRFAAEIVTKKGRVYKFDSIECMIAAVITGKIPKEEVKTYWVKDFATQEWIHARQAYFLQAVKIRSPMGVNLLAFATRREMENAKQRYEGLEHTFEDLPNVIRTSGLLRRIQQHLGPMNPSNTMSPPASTP